MTDFEKALRAMAHSKPVTLNELRASGIIGRKYPYDRVVREIDELKDITTENISRIIRSGNWESGKRVGYKKLSTMVKNPKAKEIILSL